MMMMIEQTSTRRHVIAT